MIATIEKIFKALGDKSRLRIINMLHTKPMCVCEIKEVLQLSQSTVSGHLRVLKEAGLVEDEKDGLWVEYRLNYENEFNKGILKQIAEILEADDVLTAERDSAARSDRNLLSKS